MALRIHDASHRDRGDAPDLIADHYGRDVFAFVVAAFFFLFIEARIFNGDFAFGVVVSHKM
jgi:hypothetical protein